MQVMRVASLYRRQSGPCVTQPPCMTACINALDIMRVGLRFLPVFLHCLAQVTWVPTLESVKTRAVSSSTKLAPVQPPTPLKASATNKPSPP
jgi:hypothetical protein